MANSRRKKKSGSLFGPLVLEIIALIVFFLLFTNARSHRESTQPIDETRDSSSLVQTQQQLPIHSPVVYQMYEKSPLQELLAENQSPSESPKSTSFRNLFFRR